MHISHQNNHLPEDTRVPPNDNLVSTATKGGESLKEVASNLYIVLKTIMNTSVPLPGSLAKNASHGQKVLKSVCIAGCVASIAVIPAFWIGVGLLAGIAKGYEYIKREETKSEIKNLQGKLIVNENELKKLNPEVFSSNIKGLELENLGIQGQIGELQKKLYGENPVNVKSNNIENQRANPSSSSSKTEQNESMLGINESAIEDKNKQPLDEEPRVKPSSTKPLNPEIQLKFIKNNIANFSKVPLKTAIEQPQSEKMASPKPLPKIPIKNSDLNEPEASTILHKDLQPTTLPEINLETHPPAEEAQAASRASAKSIPFKRQVSELAVKETEAGRRMDCTSKIIDMVIKKTGNDPELEKMSKNFSNAAVLSKKIADKLKDAGENPDKMANVYSSPEFQTYSVFLREIVVNYSSFNSKIDKLIKINELKDEVINIISTEISPQIAAQGLLNLTAEGVQRLSRLEIGLKAIEYEAVQEVGTFFDKSIDPITNISNDPIKNIVDFNSKTNKMQKISEANEKINKFNEKISQLQDKKLDSNNEIVDRGRLESMKSLNALKNITESGSTYIKPEVRLDKLINELKKLSEDPDISKAEIRGISSNLLKSDWVQKTLKNDSTGNLEKGVNEIVALGKPDKFNVKKKYESLAEVTKGLRGANNNDKCLVISDGTFQISIVSEAKKSERFAAIKESYNIFSDALESGVVNNLDDISNLEILKLRVLGDPSLGKNPARILDKLPTERLDGMEKLISKDVDLQNKMKYMTYMDIKIKTNEVTINSYAMNEFLSESKESVSTILKKANFYSDENAKLPLNERKDHLLRSARGPIFTEQIFTDTSKTLITFMEQNENFIATQDPEKAPETGKVFFGTVDNCKEGVTLLLKASVKMLDPGYKTSATEGANRYKEMEQMFNDVSKPVDWSKVQENVDWFAAELNKTIVTNPPSAEASIESESEKY